MTEEKSAAKSDLPVCGIVMPISEIDGCADDHWAEVLEIVSDAVKTSGFEPNLVSSSEDIGVIQKRIVQNLYENPIVVCDVSAKNPNVMFELGMRLAFDKPTIIIKDDKTSYSFDTSPIEHLNYPRDLRFNSIVLFKEKLVSKIQKTYESSNNNENYTSFLGHFGTFKIAHINSKEVSSDEYIIEQIGEIKEIIRRSSFREHNRSRFNIDENLIKLYAPKIKRICRSYSRSNKISIRDIDADDVAFFSTVVDEVKPHEDFPRRDDFLAFLKMVIATMY